jgi:hypothetical protein
MPPFLIVLVAIVLVAGMLLWLGALADAVDSPPEAFAAIGRTKRSTIVLIALTWVFGGIWYWIAMRAELRRASRGF